MQIEANKIPSRFVTRFTSLHNTDRAISKEIQRVVKFYAIISVSSILASESNNRLRCSYLATGSILDYKARPSTVNRCPIRVDWVGIVRQDWRRSLLHPTTPERQR